MTGSINNTDDIAGIGLKIIGFGNRFRSDDGFGPAVIEELEKIELAAGKNIEIIDGGTSGSELIMHIRECPRIIIVDALDAGQEKGSIICIREKDIQDFFSHRLSGFSLHDLDLSRILELARAMKLRSDITIIGVNPISIDFGDRLSKEVRSRIPEVMSMIKEMI